MRDVAVTLYSRKHILRISAEIAIIDVCLRHFIKFCLDIQEEGRYRSWISRIAWLKHVDRIQIKKQNENRNKGK